jgi:hypothetical protein
MQSPRAHVPSPRILSAALSAKVHRVRSAIELLPAAERPPWRDALALALGGAQVRAGGPLPPGAQQLDPGASVPTDAEGNPRKSLEAQEAEHLQTTEWDLALANWLDRVYGIVTGRVKELGGAAWEGLGEGVRQVTEGTRKAVFGGGMWGSIAPALLAFAVAGGAAYALSRR